MHDWVVWCRSKKGAEEIHSFELSGKGIFFKYDETKWKEEKNKKNGSRKKAHRGQSVRYRSWWKQGNNKMALSENHAWVHKDVTVMAKQNQILLTAARASGYRAGILDGHRDRQIRRLWLPRHSHSG